jgi:dolichyl-phosphate beta-glucosyltransferase
VLPGNADGEPAAQPDVSIVVPAYNEAGRIAQTLVSIQQYLDGLALAYEVIVSADGTDGTRERAAEVARGDARVTVIGTPERHGKGRGIRLGVARARGRLIGFVDADYKTPIDEIQKILPWFTRGYDIVIGSRGLGDSRIEVPQVWFRRWGSRAFGLGMHLVIGLWAIRDTQCGFKFFRAAVAKDLFARQRIDGYMFDVEILHLAERSGYRLKEVGVRWRDDGDSRLDLIAGNWQNARDILRIRFTSYPSHPIAAMAPDNATRRAS